MCLCMLFELWCVMLFGLLVGTFCCVCLCMCLCGGVVCGLLCDVVWSVLCFVCLCVLCVCAFVNDGVMLIGSFLGCVFLCLCVRVCAYCFNVLPASIRDVLRDVVGFLFRACGVVFVWFVCKLSCDGV